MSNNKKVISNSIVYTVNNIMLHAINFLLLPLYTKYLTTADYGISNMVSSFNAAATFIITFCLYNAITRFYVDYKDDVEKVKSFFGTIICFVIISGFIFLTLALVFRNVLMSYLFSGIQFFPVILIAVISVVFLCLYNIYQEILKGMQLAMKSSIVTLAYFFIHLALNIIFVVKCQWGVNGVLLSSLIVNILFVVFMFLDLKSKKLIKFNIDSSMLIESLKYSIPLLPHNLSTQITQLVSKVLINNSNSLSSVGIYSLASHFGTVSDLVQSSVNTAYRPWFFDQMNKGEKNLKSDVNTMSDILMWIYGIVFLCLGLFSQEAVLIMTSESYAVAWTVVPFIIATYTIKTPYYFYINILFYYKEATKYIFLATLTGSIINIYLSYQLIPIYGIYGSVFADAIAMILRVGIIVVLSYRYDKLGYNIWKFIGITFLNISVIFIGLYFSYTIFLYEINFWNFIYKCFIFSIYIGLFLLMQRKRFPLFFKVLKERKKRKRID